MFAIWPKGGWHKSLDVNQDNQNIFLKAYSELLERLIDLALDRYEEKSTLKTDFVE